jgi:hypothetical protein
MNESERAPPPPPPPPSSSPTRYLYAIWQPWGAARRSRTSQYPLEELFLHGSTTRDVIVSNPANVQDHVKERGLTSIAAT